MHTFVILNVTEGGVKDLLYFPFNIDAPAPLNQLQLLRTNDSPHSPASASPVQRDRAAHWMNGLSIQPRLFQCEIPFRRFVGIVDEHERWVVT
jgi:hypothetical protein